MNELAGNVLVHIGYHKTATTWLQNELFVSGNSVFEPLSQGARGHSSLAELFFRGEDGYLLSPFSTNEQQIIKELQKILHSKPQLSRKIAVMSHERLSGSPHSSGFDAAVIASRLLKLFPAAKVLIVLRNQADMILANYFQYLFQGGTHDIGKYLEQGYDGKRPGFSPHSLDYVHLVSEYMDLFGQHNVLVLPYELFRLNPSEFLGELGRLVGKTITMDSASFTTTRYYRRHHWSLYHLRILGKFSKSTSLNDYSGLYTRPGSAIARKVIGIFEAIVPESLDRRLESKIRMEIDDWLGSRFHQGNRKLARLIDRDLGDYGYY